MSDEREIVVQLSAEAAAAFADPERSSPIQDTLIPGLADLELLLEPMHPGENDPTLSSYFTVTVPDRETAQRAIDRLRASDVVEAAYVKPPSELP